MNEHEIGRIAAAMHVLRPDWPLAQLTTLLNDARMIDRRRHDATIALAWVACESDSASPYRVLTQGPWWKAVVVDNEPSTYRPPRADEMCQTHGAGWIDACPGCRADQLAGDSTPPRRQRIEPTPEYLAARQALRNHEETP